MTTWYKKSVGYEFEGQPRLVLNENGATFEFPNGSGQPVMDKGLENDVILSLFINPNWVGNYFIGGEHKIGETNFSSIASGTLTRSLLLDLEKEAKRALNWMIDGGLASKIETEILNYSGFGMQLVVKIYKPDGNIQDIVLRKNGLNWYMQQIDPASERLVENYGY